MLGRILRRVSAPLAANSGAASAETRRGKYRKIPGSRRALAFESDHLSEIIHRGRGRRFKQLSIAMESNRTKAQIWSLGERLGTAVAAAFLSGCAAITAHTADGKALVMSQDDFGKYVEHVFRYHNQVMNDLIEAAEDRGNQDGEEAVELSRAESAMIQICQPLNEAVSQSLAGENVGLKAGLDLIDSVPACEKATHLVDDLIP
jgi:hypothetical protein